MQDFTYSFAMPDDVVPITPIGFSPIGGYGFFDASKTCDFRIRGWRRRIALAGDSEAGAPAGMQHANAVSHPLAHVLDQLQSGLETLTGPHMQPRLRKGARTLVNSIPARDVPLARAPPARVLAQAGDIVGTGELAKHVKCLVTGFFCYGPGYAETFARMKAAHDMGSYSNEIYECVRGDRSNLPDA